MEAFLLLKPPGKYSPGSQGTWGIFVSGKIDLQGARNLLTFQINFFPNYFFIAILTLNKLNFAQTFGFVLLRGKNSAVQNH